MGGIGEAREEVMSPVTNKRKGYCLLLRKCQGYRERETVVDLGDASGGADIFWGNVYQCV